MNLFSLNWSFEGLKLLFWRSEAESFRTLWSSENETDSGSSDPPFFGDVLVLALPSGLKVSAELKPEHEEVSGHRLLLSWFGFQSQVHHQVLEAEHSANHQFDCLFRSYFIQTTDSERYSSQILKLFYCSNFFIQLKNSRSFLKAALKTGLDTNNFYCLSVIES